ncbi:hypothetical protein CR513_33243, partial [Mucuna pruriens]
MAKNEMVTRMEKESLPCGDGGEATVRCCESMTNKQIDCVLVCSVQFLKPVVRKPTFEIP